MSHWGGKFPVCDCAVMTDPKVELVMLKFTSVPSATGLPRLSVTVALTTVVAVPFRLLAPKEDSNANDTF